MESRSRFEALLPHTMIADLDVLLVGCGAVGSKVAIELAKLGFSRFHLFDHDRVEEANMGVAAFDGSHVRMAKVTAVREMIVAHGPGSLPMAVHAHFLRYKREARSTRGAYDIWIAAVDDVPTRQLVWAAYNKTVDQHKHGDKRMLYIDPRMGPTEFEIHATSTDRDRQFNPDQRKGYETLFYADVEPQPCGMQSMPFTASACAAAVTGTIYSWVLGAPMRCMNFMHTPTMQVINGSELEEFNEADFAKPTKRGAAKPKVKRKKRVTKRKEASGA